MFHHFFLTVHHAFFLIDLQPNTISEKLGPKYASVPTINLKDNPDFYDDLLR